jgi:tetratricopeptide (TPR) repeat protein
VAKTPEDKIQIYMTSAIAYVDVGEFNRAVRLVEKANAVNPDFNAVQTMLGRVELFRGRYAASQAALERAAILAPKNPQPHFGLMELAYARSDTAGAIAAFNQAIDLLPPGIWSEIRDAAVAAWSHRLDEAMQGLDRFLARPNPDHEKFEVMNNFGKLLHDFGRLDKAESLFQRASALDISRRESTAFNNLGMVSMHRGQYDEAESRLRRATEARYANGQSHQWRALNAVLRHDLRLAEQILQAESRIEPRVSLSKIAVLIQCERGDFAEARALAEKCVAADSTRISHELLAWVLIAGGLDVERGVAEAQQALTLPAPMDREYKLPCWPPAEHSLGLAALERGDSASAVEQLKRAAKRSPWRESVKADLTRAQAGAGTP